METRASRADAALHDLDVQEAVDTMVRHYHAEEAQRHPPAANLADRAQRVFTSVQAVCEWRLGRSPLPARTEMSAGRPQKLRPRQNGAPVTVCNVRS